MRGEEKMKMTQEERRRRKGGQEVRGRELLYEWEKR